ncbi:hypothetical protein SDC9_70957 [bioreactor metagenome]|uniref:LTXXQ motif family protein n=1 Tax=bioreactor metagenome TaxID=1076179 RepID=A0A644YE86_9ZZZZ
MARFTTRSFAATALAAAMFAAAAAPSFAQTAAPAAPAAAAASAPTDAKPGHRPHARGERMTPEQRQERMAKRADAFKQKLKLTTDQEPAWNTFQEALHPKDKPEHARLDRKEMDKLTTPERIDRMRAVHAHRSAEMDRRGEAVKTFYATLKPEQQKVFDQESARMMHRFGPGEHRGKGARDGREGGHRDHKHRAGHEGKRHHGHGAGAAPAAAPADAAAPAAPVQPQ